MILKYTFLNRKNMYLQKNLLKRKQKIGFKKEILCYRYNKIIKRYLIILLKKLIKSNIYI